MSTIRCEASTDQALCVLMRHNILVRARFRKVADSSPRLRLAGMIPKEVIVSTKEDYYTTNRCAPSSTVRALCTLMRLVIYP